MTSDFLVVGAGVAGMRAAIELAKAGRVLVVAKDSLRESSSEYAQGGIAAAFRAIAFRSAGESFAVFACRPLCPPSLPSATAAGFFPVSGSGWIWPVAESAMNLAS